MTNRWILSTILLMLSCVFKESIQQCSTTLSLTVSDTDIGIIQSRNNPSNYDNSMTCIWLITTGTADKTVVLSLKEFNLERNYDFLRIYDGDSTTAPLLGLLSGQRSQEEYISSGKNMYLKFTTDHSVTRSGFKMTYFSIWRAPSSNMVRLACSATSSQSIEFTSVRKTVLLSTFPDTYSGSDSCRADITAISSSFRLTLLFADFQYTSAAGLTIYDGYGNIIVAMSNSDAVRYTSMTVEVNTPNGTLEYRRASTQTYTGFVISAISDNFTNSISSVSTAPTVPVYSGCGGDYVAVTSTYATLQSVNFPYDYPNSIRCGWRIDTQDANYAVKIVMVSINTESCCDYLIIYDGYDSNYNRLVTFRGSPSLSNYTTSGRYAYVYFSSDTTVVNTGFQLKYIAVSTGVPSCVSYPSLISLVATTTRQSLVSHSSYNTLQYSNGLNTYWLLTKSDEAQALVLYTNLFRIESSTTCQYDYLKIYNGACLSDGVLYDLCGSRSGEYFTHSYGKYVLLHFHTDGSVTNIGFQVTYYLVPQGYNYDQTQNTEVPYKENETLNGKIIIYTIIPIVVIIIIVIVVICRVRANRYRTAHNSLAKTKKELIMTKSKTKAKPSQNVEKARRNQVPSVNTIVPPSHPLPIHPVTHFSVAPSDPVYPPVAPINNPYYQVSGTYNYMSSQTEYAPRYTEARAANISNIPSAFDYNPLNVQ